MPLLTDDDVYCLMGQAVILRCDGKKDMPAYFFGLAERIAQTIGNPALAQCVREVDIRTQGDATAKELFG